MSSAEWWVVLCGSREFDRVRISVDQRQLAGLHVLLEHGTRHKLGDFARALDVERVTDAAKHKERRVRNERVQRARARLVRNRLVDVAPEEQHRPRAVAPERRKLCRRVGQLSAARAARPINAPDRSSAAARARD